MVAMRQFQLFAVPGLCMNVAVLTAVLASLSPSSSGYAIIPLSIFLAINMLNIYLVSKCDATVDFIPLMMPLRVLMVTGVVYYLIFLCRLFSGFDNSSPSDFNFGNKPTSVGCGFSFGASKNKSA